MPIRFVDVDLGGQSRACGYWCLVGERGEMCFCPDVWVACVVDVILCVRGGVVSRVAVVRVVRV